MIDLDFQPSIHEFRAWNYDTEQWNITASYNVKGGVIRSRPEVTQTVVTFTGVFDVEGKKIWEGDICRNERNELGIIERHGNSYVLRYVPPYNWDAMEPCDGLIGRSVVLGNVFENKELLNEDATVRN